jgi:hypothetical protein
MKEVTGQSGDHRDNGLFPASFQLQYNGLAQTLKIKLDPGKRGRE